jgi:hypothetical protein
MVLHGNFRHSEWPFGSMRQALSQGWYRQLLSSIQVPTELSYQGEDVLFLDIADRKSLTEIDRNPLISVTPGFQTHMLASSFPQLRRAQIEITLKVLAKYIPRKKLSWVHCWPEMDVSSLGITDFLATVGSEGGILSLKDLNCSYEYWPEDQDTRKPLKDEIILCNGVPVFVAEASEMRSVYLRMHRNETTPQDFVYEMRRCLAASKHNLVIFFTDLEVPLINHVNGVPQLDKWVEFQKILRLAEKSGIRFAHFNDIKEGLHLMAMDAPVATIDERDSLKWHGRDPEQTRIIDTIYKEIAEALGYCSDPVDALPFVVSDTFSAQTVQRMDFSVLESPGSNQVTNHIVIQPDTKRRMDEFHNLLEMAKAGKLGTVGDDHTRWHSEIVQEAHLRTKEIVS